MTDETTTKNLVAAVAERDRRIAELAQALLDSADKVDAAVSAAVAAERARIRARVEALARMEAVARHDMQICDAGDHDHGYWHADDVLDAIGATEGGAP